MSEYLKTWVEINRSAIKKNYRTFRNILSPGIKLMAVVKSNAYGHGLAHFAKEISKLGADFLAVDDIDEALILRKSGIKKPILVFGYVPDSFIKEASLKNISLTISNFDFLRKIIKTKLIKKIKIHIEVDTGLGRQGFLGKDLPAVLVLIKKSENIETEGLYTHFAIAENPKFFSYTKKQIENFKIWIQAFRQNSFKPIAHSSASAETMRSSEFHFDMVRVGISMYGLFPSKEIKKYVKTKIELEPVLFWKTIVSEIKKLPKGHNIGYDLTETLKRDSIIGICPIGYWHGYPRALSGKGEVLVRGKRAKVLGRVSMDMITVDLTEIKGAKRGDEAVLIGQSKNKRITAEEVANQAETINYEIVTRINTEIMRIYK